MTVLDDALRPIATTLIAQFGASITLTRLAPGVYDPATSTTTPTRTAAATKALVEDVKGRELTEGLIEAGDRKFYVAAEALAFEPTPADEIDTGDGRPWIARVVRSHYSGEQVALFEIIARQT